MPDPQQGLYADPALYDILYGPDTWREHILRLADETALRRHLGKSARRTALENFDCDLAVDLYEELPSK